MSVVSWKVFFFEVEGLDGWHALDRKEGAPRHYEQLTVTVTQESGDTRTAVTLYQSTRGRTVR